MLIEDDYADLAELLYLLGIDSALPLIATGLVVIGSKVTSKVQYLNAKRD